MPGGSPQIIRQANNKQKCFWQEIVVLKRQQMYTLASSLEMYGFLTATVSHNVNECFAAQRCLQLMSDLLIRKGTPIIWPLQKLFSWTDGIE